MKVAFALGCLAVGFALGWWARPAVERPPPSPRDRLAEHASTPATLRGTGDREHPEDDEGSGTATSEEAPPPRTPREVEALAVQLGAARTAGNWRTFYLRLRDLARARTPEAHRVLAALLADASLTFPERVGSLFHEGLAGTTIDGLAAAAKRRFAQAVAAGNTSWTAADGWFRIVADHGGADDRAWLLARDESEQIRSRALQALAHATNPAGGALVVDWLEAPDWHPDRAWLLSQLVKGQPEAAYGFARRHLERVRDGQEAPDEIPTVDLMRALGGSVPEAQAGQAEAFLLSLRDEEQRVLAAYAVEAMRRRGMDVSALATLVHVPIDLLNGLAPGVRTDPPVDRWAYFVAQAIRANRAIWSGEAADALEAAAARLEGTDAPVDDLRDAAGQIRAWLASPWRTD